MPGAVKRIKPVIPRHSMIKKGYYKYKQKRLSVADSLQSLLKNTRSLASKIRELLIKSNFNVHDIVKV